MKKYRLKEVYSTDSMKRWKVEVSFDPFNWIWFPKGSRFSDSNALFWKEARGELNYYVCTENARQARKKALKSFKPIILSPPLPDKEPA